MVGKLKTLGQEPVHVTVEERARYYSPTQIALYKACPRKWFFQYPLGYKPPTSDAMALGTAIHAEIEEFYKTGKEPEDSRAKAGLRTLPAPSEHTLAEGKIEFEIRDGVRFTGFVDLIDKADPTHPRVIDHKTTSNLKYAKASYELESDVQMMSYAAWVCGRDENVERVTVAHNVIPTRGGDARLTSIEVTREHVADRWRKHLAIIDEMETAREGRVNDQPTTGEGNGTCEKFGGCPHKSRCAAASLGVEIEPYQATTQEETVQAILPPDAPASSQIKRENNDVNTSDKLAALKALAGTAPAPKKKAPKKKDVQLKLPEGAEDVLKAAEAEDNAAEAELMEIVKQIRENEAPGNIVIPQTSTLFVNCRPDGGDVVDVAVFLAPLLDTIKAETGLGYWSHKFGEGKALVMAGLDRVTLPSALYIDTRTQLGQLALEGLAPKASQIVRGVA